MKHSPLSIFSSFIFLFVTVFASAQSYRNPLDIPPALSGNFGELRNNHFHSGIDYKTQGMINKPIFAIEDGYVSRISVSPWGYGLALYINHPTTGHTSVYGHLDSFSKQIADYVKQKQYEQERFRVDLSLSPEEIPVKRGQQVALSGNTGSSGGPHVHFEVRDTKSEEPLDPLRFFGKSIADTQKPDIRGIAFYPVTGKGSVNNTANPLRITLSKNKSGTLLPLNRTINAWGKIGVGVKAYDKMNGQNNVYGVKHVRLFVDDTQVFESNINRFSFAKSRMLNSFVDFEDWREQRSFFMRSFIEPGNTLPFYNNVKDNGYIDILEERPYKFRYELEDDYGNTTIYSFTVEGKKQSIPLLPYCRHFMAWNLNNSIVDFDFILDIPAGNLYNNVCFEYQKTSSSRFFSDIVSINKTPVPLQGNATVWLKMKSDSMDDRSKYGVVRIDKRGNPGWVGGSYKNGGMEFTINELGANYAVDIDTVAPKITPVEPAKWVQQKRIRIRLSDDKSGINEFRGTINGKFVLFTHDGKSNIYTYVFDNDRLIRGRQTFVFSVSDSAGNSDEYEYNFDW